MAKQMKITRTLIVGYNYNVLRQEGNTMNIIGAVSVPTVIRSMKEQKAVLTANKYQESDVLVLTGSTQKQYEMSEADFMKYATVVTDVKEGSDDSNDKEQENTQE
jgi:hypothetical protein